MKNEPVAWMLVTGHGTKILEKKPYCEVDYWKPLYTQDQLEEARKLGMQQERALWNLSVSTQEIMDTNPVNTCKHGVDDGACKECYIEVTHPVKEQLKEVAKVN